MSEITRPPVVTILGHVDHGKTTLLDYIRKTAVASKEHGGITQAVGAYQTEIDNKVITFIDTPGHAAFEKMRFRGAQLADIAVLVIAVDDGVMPQTVEAVKHIQSAGIPMIAAINKVDLLSTLRSPGGDLKTDFSSPELKIALEKIKKQLSDQKVLVEEYGGDVPLVPVSAKTGKGVNDLLETINLVAEIHELKGDPSKKALGVIIESRLDKFRGAVATVLIRDGSLKKGDFISAGGSKGKVRGMFDWAGKPAETAGPSMPVEVLGFESVPAVGTRLGEAYLAEVGLNGKVLSLIDKLKTTESKVLNVVLRADKQGSLEAVEAIINKFNESEQHIKILDSGTGDIVEKDVDLAGTTGGIVIGFNVSVASAAKKLAETEHVLVRTYNIIYELADELEEVVEGMLKPGRVEEVFGRAQVLAEFPYGKNEKIAGCKVVEGVFSKGPKVRIVRGDEVVGETKIKSLKKGREETTKVEKGMECGMMFDPAIDFQVGDIVESFRVI